MRLALALALVAGCTPTAAPPAPAAPAPAAEPASEPEPAAPDETSILRAVLTHESFAPYLHPEVEGRVPIVVSGSARPKGPIDLELHGAKVELADAARRDTVTLTEWTVEQDSAHVALTYDVEGVVATFDLARTPTGWNVTNADVAER